MPSTHRRFRRSPWISVALVLTLIVTGSPRVDGQEPETPAADAPATANATTVPATIPPTTTAVAADNGDVPPTSTTTTASETEPAPNTGASVGDTTTTAVDQTDGDPISQGATVGDTTEDGSTSVSDETEADPLVDEEDGGDADQENVDVWEPIPGFTGGGPVISTNPIERLGEAYDRWERPVTIAGQAALAAAARAVAVAEADLVAYEDQLDEARSTAEELTVARDDAIATADAAADQAAADAATAMESELLAAELHASYRRARTASLLASSAVGRAAHDQDLNRDRLLAMRAPIEAAGVVLREAARQLDTRQHSLRELAVAHYITNDVTADLPRLEPDGSDDVQHATKRVSREAVIDLRERHYRTARGYEAESRAALGRLLEEERRRQRSFDAATARVAEAVDQADVAAEQARWARAASEAQQAKAEDDRASAERSAEHAAAAADEVLAAGRRIEAAERLIERAEQVLIAAGTQLGQLRSVADVRAAGASQAAAGALVGAGEVTFPIAGDWNFIDSWGFPRSGGRHHQGADIFAPAGTPLVAIEAGSVEVSLNRLGGLVVYLNGESGNRYYYAHLESVPPAISADQLVEPGDVIGFVGTSGNAAGTPPHLHFEVRPGGGAKVNPYPLLRALSGAVTQAQLEGATALPPDGQPANANATEPDGPTTASELADELADVLTRRG